MKIRLFSCDVCSVLHFKKECIETEKRCKRTEEPIITSVLDICFIFGQVCYISEAN